MKSKLKKAKDKEYVSSESDESVLNFDDKDSDIEDSEEKETEAQDEDMVAEEEKDNVKTTQKKGRGRPKKPVAKNMWELNNKHFVYNLLIFKYTQHVDTCVHTFSSTRKVCTYKHLRFRIGQGTQIRIIDNFGITNLLPLLDKVNRVSHWTFSLQSAVSTHRQAELQEGTQAQTHLGSSLLLDKWTDSQTLEGWASQAKVCPLS